MSEAWPRKRRKELHELLEMLATIRTLNNGSNFIGKVQQLIKTSDKFDKLNLESAQPNFSQFLTAEAFGEGGES